MSRIDELIAGLCPDGVEYRPLRDVGIWQGGGTPSKHNTDYWRGGTIPWVTSKDMGAFDLSDTEDYITESAVEGSAAKIIPPNSVAIVMRSGILKHTLPVSLVPFVATVNQDLRALTCHDDVMPRYALHVLRANAGSILVTCRKVGGTVESIDAKRLMAFRIPVPPLEVQREIVRVLDAFTQLEAELEAELEARRRQYAHYRDALLTFPEGGVRWATLGELGRVSMCKRVFKSDTSADGEIPFFKIGTFGSTPDAFISRQLYEDYRARYSFPKKGDVLISAAGTIGRAVIYDGEPAYFQDSNIVWIDHDESLVTNAYLRYWYSVIDWTTDGGTIRRLYNENIRRAKIALPPLEEQARIVAILDQFDALVNDLSSGLPAELAARRSQYEYYRDRLLTFKEAAA